jgi:uncharacterized protein with PQ loop repeat
MLSTREVFVDVLGLLALVFNGLLIYSLSVNRESVSVSVWNLLVIREVFGVICFMAMYAQRWAARGSSVLFFFVYFISLFCFAIAELVVMSIDAHGGGDSIDGSKLPLPVFAWFFVGVDWLVVFTIFVMGIFVYDDRIPSLFGWGDYTNHHNDGNEYYYDTPNEEEDGRGT